MKRIIIVVFLFNLNALFSQGNSYLEFDEDDSTTKLKNLSLLDSVAVNYRVFMTGEDHTYANLNNIIELDMLKYLNEKRNVRHLVFELGFARGYMVDRYINDDSTLIDQLILNTDYKYLEFYRKLRKFNLSLPVEKRITVHGIDVERYPDDAPILMGMILDKDTVIPQKIDFLVEVIRSYAEYCKSGYKYRNQGNYSDYNYGYYRYDSRIFDDDRVLDSIIIQYDIMKPEFNTYLGKDSLLFEESVRSLKEYLLYSKYERMPHQYIYRERFMFENMKRLLKSDTNARFFGQFGRCHIGLTKAKNECDWWNHSSLANRLNNSEYKEQVLSIGIFYNEYYRFYNYSSYSEEKNLDYRAEYSARKYMDSIGDNKLALVKINRDDSILLERYSFLIMSKYYYFKPIGAERLKSDYTALDFSYGQSIFNFKNLNRAIDPGGNGFNNTITTYGFNISISSYNFYNVYDFKYFVPQKIANGNIKYNLGGFSMLEGVGYSPYLSKRFAIAPYFLFGYSRLTLDVINDSLNNKISPAFSEYKSSKFANNSLSLGVGLDLRYNFASVFGIFAKGHFLADPSYYQWRKVEGLNNKLDKASPKTSLLNYGLSAGISILIMDY